jgi:hypothetical protein
MEDFLTMARSHGGDGIRFYYGAYPENYEAKPEYAGRQMLIMVGTKTKITETGAIADKDIYISKKGEIELLCSFNPSGCPPTCNPPSEGGLGDLGITILDRGKNGMEII